MALRLCKCCVHIKRGLMEGENVPASRMGANSSRQQPRSFRLQQDLPMENSFAAFTTRILIEGHHEIGQ